MSSGSERADRDARAVSGRLRAWCAGVLCVLLSLLPGPGQALDPGRHVAQFHHTAWTVADGAPGQVTALAQTADGYLWLGTQFGLFRFDGVEFERVAPTGADAFPAASISALHASADGGLWIGFRYGAVSVLRDGAATHYGEAEGLPSSTVFRFAQDREGRLWAATFTGLVYLRDGRWHRLGPEWAFPGRQARTAFVDAAGTLWVATDQGLAFLRRGTTRFQRVPAAVGRVSGIAQAPDGGIWIAEADGAVREVSIDGRTVATPSIALPSAGLLFDRDGALWATTLGEGLLRLPHPAAADAGFERFRRIDGLGSDYLQPLLEDHEGTIWVGSSRGLDRFRHANVVPARLPDGAQDFAIVADGDGALLVGSRNQPLMRLQDRELDFLDLAVPLTAGHRDRRNTVWLGGPDGLWTLRDGHLAETLPLPLDDYSGVQAIATCGDGTLWVSLNTPGVYRLADGRWSHLADLPGMPEGSSPLSLLCDARDRLWMGFARNAILLLQDGRPTPIGAEQGLEVGNVSALAEDATGMWVGGDRGLARVEDGRVRSAHGGDAFSGISGIVATPGGDLWLNGARGILHLPAAERPYLFDAQGRRPAYARFDFLDGVPGIPAQFRPIPTAARTGDGRLWFATTSGVVSIDPGALRRNPVPPPVHVRAVQADGRSYPAGRDALQLPAGIQNLQIAYTALSLAIPERVRFRYLLEGYDREWQDAGTRRVAFYNDPGPGSYTFRVIAANNDGVWNEVGAGLPLVIAPLYWQTAWFRVLCALLALALLWIAYLSRLRRVAAQVRVRMQERHMERERIARELHDTLLQGMHGLILRLHAAAQRLRADDPLRDELETTMDLAEQAMAEGRDRVSGLRGGVRHGRDLGEALLQVAEEAGWQPPPEVRLVVEGTPRALCGGVAEELYLIGREAVLNALRHARAGMVTIELGYARRELRLRVRDDGIGMPVREPGRPGHWGLDGMRERAARIGGQLRLDSQPGAGTTVAVRLPAAAAYRPRRRGLRAAVAGLLRRRT
ncbi:sensor histidine kinase [Coralloluteibacterium stylophorae]|uniref:ATPase n=1 Tax=Coralloluteibacterium stylophorae TaxID=1776034 RepID=A0A8J8AWW1_9GAMM|nr:sensor histidine kinase [Coralloluteibacterium stylophorae]MBS7456870.1 ATPase [Coralloluteibacterium stylophorae]